MLLCICVGSPAAIQQAEKQLDIVQSRISLHCSRRNYYYILVPDLSNRMLAFNGYCIAVGIIARLHSRAVRSLLKKKVNTTIFFFQRQVYVHNQLYKCRLLITFENNSDPTKCSCDNACMCSLVSAGLIIIVVKLNLIV